jgi:hypothetical protein
MYDWYRVKAGTIFFLSPAVMIWIMLSLNYNRHSMVLYYNKTIYAIDHKEASHEYVISAKSIPWWSFVGEITKIKVLR